MAETLMLTRVSEYGFSYSGSSLWQCRCVLCKILMAVCIGNGKVGVGTRQVHCAGLAVNNVICSGNHVKVAHLMDQCASFGVGA